MLIVSDDTHDECVCQYCHEHLPKDRVALMTHAKLCVMVSRPVKSYRFVCYTCSYHTQFSNRFSDHIKHHIKAKNFGCPYCPYTAVTQSTVKKHMIVRHSNAPRKKCEFCNFTSKLKGQMNFHVKTKHRDLFMNDEN